MCCDLARAAGSIEVGDILSKDGMKVVLADTFGISFTGEGPGSHIYVCGKPCPYAFEEKVSMGDEDGGKFVRSEEGRRLTNTYQPKGKSGGITLEIISRLSILLRGILPPAMVMPKSTNSWPS